MKRAFWLGLLAGPMLAGTAWAQPGVPSPSAAPAAPRNIWSFFTMTPEQSDRCKGKFCNSAIGKMFSASMGPMSAFSGGLIQDRCAAKAIEDILKDKDKEGGAEGAAAKIKKEEAAAKARRAAVRFLGTVDCARFPEAKDVLIASLVDDTNECVRYEAALALQSGCCCNKETVKALTDVITGKTRIPETSERVKAAAVVALGMCEVPVTPSTIDGKKIEELKKVELSPSEYQKHIRELPRAQVMEEARQALAEYRARQSVATNASAQAGPHRVTSVAAILSNAFAPSSHGATAGAVEMAAQPSDHSPLDSKVVNAIPTSRSDTVASPSQTTTAPAVQSAPIERRPFFDGLTRTLKGKQTGRTTTIPTELLATPDSSSPVIVDGDVRNPAAPRPLPADIRPTLGIPAGPTPRTSPIVPAVPQQP